MISVVIATYNGEKYIAEQLRSVMCQTVPADEVLIFDDGSTDGTVKKVSDFIENNGLTGWHIFVNEENLGYSRNFLNGIAEASGDYIFLADQDDVWHEDKIEKMVAALSENDGIKALLCSCGVVGKNGEQVPDDGSAGVVFKDDDGTLKYFSPEKFIGRSFTRGCSLCFKKDIVPFLYDICLDGLLSHDWLICFTAALCGGFAVFNKRLMDYRLHGENNSFGQKCTLEKRISALKNSVEGHSFVLSNSDSYPLMTPAIEKKLKKQIDFESKRIDYLENGGFIRLLKCLFSLNGYKCYYGTAKGMFRVFLGDIAYRRKG